MRYVILGGAGRQGQAIAKYLVECTQGRIISVDIEDHPEWMCRSRITTETLERGESWTWDGTTYNDRFKIKDSVVISCLDPEDNIATAQEVIFLQARGFIGLGGSDEASKTLTATLKRKKYSTTIIQDCGLAPGLPATLAGQTARDGKKECYIYCGGNAANEEDHYVRSFNIHGLLREYTGVAVGLAKGKISYTPTLSSSRFLTVGNRVWIGTETSGGLGLSPQLLEGKLQSLAYLTLRPPGHWRHLKKNILWRSTEDATNVIEAIYPEVSSQHPDVVHLAIRDDDSFRQWSWKYDHENNISAMAQATGYTAAAVATMIHDLNFEPGIIDMSELDFAEIVNRARQMPNQFI